ncbi:carbohydrate ABC transporter permease [Cryptosporangium aurantiacum]|uniref:Carbohydrate ABC transporter membrane protein 2, CUT1 family n=1 Tax=Cryptosporangium aurantiacum TaxID=134849 RepID=A0A1M7JGW3_9ACTN|nr:carbohydrate ABC transporter permease [Cryptosporangium aurantiacum]SHM52205.1 carbohydrate ABC transporter membrane protein 2, CUT1 family [Cryptosporangium aurantiacum]
MRLARKAWPNAVALVVILFFAFPAYWMLRTAFLPTIDIQSDPPVLFPTSPTLDHFATAVERPGFWIYVRNSLFVTLAAVALSTVTALLAAVAVARFRFRGRKAYLILILAVQLAPFEALFIPYFLVFRQFDLLDRLPALILVYFVSILPFTIWTLRGFVAAVPAELEEAALVDGCTRWQAFLRVVLPLLGPGLVATSIFGFITAWNEYLYAFVFMRSEDHYTLPVWLATFRTAFGDDWGGAMAGSTLFTLPVLIFFLIVQRRMVGGLTAGAVKG